MSTIEMSENLNHNRRRFFRNATVAFAATELATIGPAAWRLPWTAKLA